VTGDGLYEEAARTRKALAYADAIARAGGTAKGAATMPDLAWRLAQVAADWPTAPSGRTKAVVVTLLEEREARRRTLPCVHCGKPVEGVSAGATIAAHGGCSQ
jgi:hypothetical protein